LERGQRRATKMIRGRDNLSYEERLRAGAVQPGEEKAPRRPYCGLFSSERGLIRTMGTGFLVRPVAIGQGVMVLN